MNVGTTIANLGSNALNEAQVIEVAKYFKNVRLGADCQNASQVALQRQQCLYAKAAGLRVIYLISAPSVGANGFSTTFYNNTYKDFILGEAAWAEANHIDEFTFANEEELRIDEGSIVDPYSLVALYYKPLATLIKGVYSGVTSFCISNGAEPWIENITPGDIDRVGFNVYGDYNATYGRCTHNSFVTRVTNFKAYENWGDRAYISEFNADYSSTRFATIANNDEKLAIEMAQKYDVLEGLGYTDIYPFCWVYASGSQAFSMKKTDGSYRNFMQVMSTGNKRRFLVNI